MKSPRKKKNQGRHPGLLSTKEQRAAQRRFHSKEDYEAQLREVQRRLLDLQQTVRRGKNKVIVVFEGPDASGKGGVIKRLTEYLDPRFVRVHATGAPNAIEKKQNYMERFFRILPSEGTIAIFDRSWYGRVLVERVEGLIPKKDWKRAYGEINAFEEMLTHDGVLILKYLLDVSFDEQKKRFKERESNPLKRWKLTDDDWRNRAKWDDYEKAFRDMLDETSTRKNPWRVIAADSKWAARFEVLSDFIGRAKTLKRDPR